jgi:hypothetical protein
MPVVSSLLSSLAQSSRYTTIGMVSQKAVVVSVWEELNVLPKM